MPSRIQRQRICQQRIAREQQIERALAVLAPSEAKIAQCRERIAFALAKIDEETEAAQVNSPSNRRRINQLIKAAKVFEQRARRTQFPDSWLVDVPDLSYWIESVEWRLAELPQRTSGRAAQFRKSHAVDWAGYLLLSYGHKPTKTRGGNWSHLAAILYGQDQDELFNFFQKVPLRRLVLFLRPR